MRVQQFEELSLPSTVGHVVSPLLSSREHIVLLHRPILVSMTGDGLDLFDKIPEIAAYQTEGYKSMDGPSGGAGRHWERPTPLGNRAEGFSQWSPRQSLVGVARHGTIDPGSVSKGMNDA